MIRFLTIFNLLLAIPAFSQIYTVQTFAGGGLPQNIQGAAADLSGVGVVIGNVSAVASDGAGNVYIALAVSSIVLKLDSNGLLTLVAGNGIAGFSGDGGPATSAELNTPTGIAVDALGSLYIADSANQRVRKVSGGIISTVAGNGTAGYNGDNIAGTSAWLLTPASVAVDADGNLYIVDKGNQRIREVSNGTIRTIAGTGTSGFSGDNGLATAAQVKSPAGIAVDSAGNIYIADTGNQRVRKISNQTILTVAGTGGFSFSSDNIPANTADLEFPSGVAVDSAGNLYIAEAIANRVRKVTNGIITTVTGTGVSGYNGDGIAASGALLNDPLGAAVDTAGNVYIADSANSRVRKVAGGIITTAAGGGTLPDSSDGQPATSARIGVGSIAVDPAGTVYSSDGLRTLKVSNNIISTFKASGSNMCLGSSDSGDIGSTVMAVDSNGSLYFVGINCVVKVSNGLITVVAGGVNFGIPGFSGDDGPATDAQLNRPTGIAVDGAGRVYIADSGNSRIRMVSNGIITTIAGTGVSGYSGDGGSAVNAQLSILGQLGIDAAGNLYVADGHYIREISAGIISTVATFSQGPLLTAVNASGGIYLADPQGKIYKLTQGAPVVIGQVGTFGGLLGIGVDNSGNVYVSDRSTERVFRLVPSAGGCATGVSPNTLQAGFFGINYVFTVQADSGCSWTTAGLPDWVTVAQQGSGTGAATVTISVESNMGSARSAQFNIGGIPVAISQDASPPCTFTFISAGRGFPSAGGIGVQSVTRNLPWCLLTATNAPDWVTITSVSQNLPTSGLVNYLVAANTGPARSGTFLIAGQPFTIDQQAGSIPGLSFIGSMPHIAAEENWTTTFTLVNKGTSPAQARFSAFAESGNPALLPLLFPQQPPAPSWLLESSLDRTLAANASLLMSTAVIPTAPVLVGTAQVGANGAVDGFAIFHLIPGAQEAVVPLETRNASSYLLAFDNTNGVVLGVAVGNVSAQGVIVTVVIRDDMGTQIGTGTVGLTVNGHRSFVLSSQFPITANIRGTIQFDTHLTGGQISVLGIRTTPLGSSNTLTTIPPLANVGTSGGAMAHLAVANGWKTTFVLVNTGASAAQAHLKFFDDQGNPLLLPLSFPQAGGGTSTVDSGVDRTLAAGATLKVESTGALTDALLTGSAQLTTNGNVGGFVIFRYQPNGQEAVVPLESRGASAYLLAFDNTGGTATGIAVSNASSQAATIPVVIRDDTGTQIGTDTITLPANGHSSFTLVVDKFAMTNGIRGTLEFDAPAGSQISALGIRIPQAHTFTTLPALAK